MMLEFFYISPERELVIHVFALDTEEANVTARDLLLGNGKTEAEALSWLGRSESFAFPFGGVQNGIYPKINLDSDSFQYQEEEV
jgi:hypothetical protein